MPFTIALAILAFAIITIALTTSLFVALTRSNKNAVKRYQERKNSNHTEDQKACSS